MSLKLEENDSLYLSIRDIIASAGEGAFLIEAEGSQQVYTAVMQLAKYLFCSSPNAEKHCDHCDNCRMLEKAIHPDLHWLKIKEKASSIKIEDIRGLKERVFIKPYQSEKKLFVIEDAHRLSPEAANALLKTLEEPPPGVLIILIADNARQLLPTILSRCKRIRFSKVFSSESAVFEDTNDFVGKFFNNQDPYLQMMICEDLSRLERSKVEFFLEQLSCIFRDMLMIRLGAADVPLISAQPINTLNDWVLDFSAASLESILDEVLKTKNLINKNSNIKLTIDLLVKHVNRHRTDA